MVQVRLTEALTTQLFAVTLDPNIQKQRFADWKSGDEYSSYLFGKDRLGLKATNLLIGFNGHKITLNAIFRKNHANLDMISKPKT